jgi:hypothetical protein
MKTADVGISIKQQKIVLQLTKQFLEMMSDAFSLMNFVVNC